MFTDAHKPMRLGFLVVLVPMFVALVLRVPGMGEQDFLIYWSAARLLAVGENPYDPVSLQNLQYETRPERAYTLASWNPPWLLVILLPLGLLPFDLAVRAWLVCNIGLILAAAAATWRLLTGASEGRAIVAVSAASLWFLPSLSTMNLGQISSLVLIGLVLGSWWLRARRDALAGAAFFVATVKPHVTYFVLLLLVLWVIRKRRWRVLWGMTVAAVLSMIVLYVMFPGWMPAYFRLTTSHSFFQYSASTLGGLFFAVSGSNLLRFAGVLALLLAPSVLRLADAQDWLTAMNAALLISVPLAVYGFAFDQVVLLPVIAQIICWLWHRELPTRVAWVIGGGLVLMYAALLAMLTLPVLYYHSYAWTPLVLAALYALAWRERQRKRMLANGIADS